MTKPIFSAWKSIKSKIAQFKDKYGKITLLIVLCILLLIIFGFYQHDFFNCAAVLAATAGITYQAHNNEIAKKKENSICYLEKYNQILNSILDILISDSPSRGAAWFYAANIVSEIELLEREITEKPDKTVLYIYKRSWVHAMHRFLSAKPAKYFYGVDEAKDMDEAFEKCGYGISTIVYSTIPKAPPITYISEEQIKIIMDLLKPIWEKEGEIKYDGSNKQFLNIMMYNYEHIYKYLEHFKKKKATLQKHKVIFS